MGLDDSFSWMFGTHCDANSLVVSKYMEPIATQSNIIVSHKI
jgi:hypothetical protein